ncbi:MAG: 50S ribosomal protein L11 methyltransferase [Deltaproteobacteria bacterium]|nr:50S ribosomal protein L11 methyltransferase [Deltaproteobacteria bacterium]
MEYYFQRYGDLELHRRMIADRPRTDAFVRAIAAVVRPQDVVLDVGTGTGILAMVAARSGAKQVYAIDNAEIIQTAANLAKANGLSKKIRFFRGLASDLILPQKADLIVSEWLGNLALVEGMLEDLVAVRDRNLARGGRMLPAKVDVVLAPLDDMVLFTREGPGFWREPVSGLDFSSLEGVELGQGRATQLRIDAAALLAPGKAMRALDLRRVRAKDAWGKGVLELEVRRDGVLNGFGGWFVADLGGGVVLDTGPGHPETHWAQTYLPFPPRLVRRGSRLRVAYRLEADQGERRHVRLELKVGKTVQEYLLE